MARVLVTGSADGLGLMSAHLLVIGGHEVTLHARNERRAADAAELLPDAEATVIGDLSTVEGIHAVAGQANALGRYDAVIHNVGVGYLEPRISTADGLEHVFAINVLAPYLLTALMPAPERLVYLSSGMARGGSADLSDPQWTQRRWNSSQAYSDSKLFDMLLAFGVARRWPDVRSNTVEPGWVPTRMGGAGAPDDLSLGPITQAWLAVSEDPAARQSGENFFHQQHAPTPPVAHSAESQDALLDYCESLTGVRITPTG